MQALMRQRPMCARSSRNELSRWSHRSMRNGLPFSRLSRRKELIHKQENEPMSQPIFISVGKTFNMQQEAFVSAVETYFRGQGLEPRTIGRNYFRNDQPLKTVTECMNECAGAIVIAFERIHIDRGTEKRSSPDESEVSGMNLPTVWNQIEAALAYAAHRPLLVLVENGLKLEGLLQTGYD